MCTSGSVALLTLLFASLVNAGKPPVITFHNDPESTGQNLDETVLTPANVKPGSFSKLHTAPVDGQVYGQPLYLPGVAIKTGPHPGPHDVVIVVTQHDSVYVIDANTGQQLWTKSFINPAQHITPVPFRDVTPNPDVTPEIGITSTPAIDVGAKILYLTPKTKEIRAGVAHYVYRLHALDIGTAAERPGSPVVIGESTGDNFSDIVSGPSVPGKGEGGSGTVVRFNAKKHFQRSGITLANGRLYLAFSSHGDNVPYHGWVLGYDAHTLTPTAVINVTPNEVTPAKGAPRGAGIWQSGGKPVVDSQGHLYLMTGNGAFNENLINGFPSQGAYGDSFVKLVIDPSSTMQHPNINGWGLKVVDYFTPFNELQLTNADIDLGSGGPLALPREVGSQHDPNLLVGAGKEGRIYLLDRDNMGKFHPNTDHVVQESGPNMVGGIWGSPAYFRDHNGVHRVYFGGVNDHVKAFTIANGKITFPASSQSRDIYNYPGTTPAISANKDQNGIVWTMDRRRTMLRAYDATDLSKELYNSNDVAGDRLPGDVTKFTVPTIADGKVFVVSQSNAAGGINALVIYGLK
jgi:hypothetical protein